MRYDIIVIGGGPAGMTAAITAARLGQKVCLLEHNDRVGKKILSTGNGKCNITNLNISKECYHSDSGKDFYNIINRFNPLWTIEYMKSLGIIIKEKGGYIYPRSEQSSTVLDGLRLELDRLGIHTVTGAIVKGVEAGFKIITSETTYQGERLILACGSKCAPKTGSDGSGYDIARSFGHTIIKPIPALVQVRCLGEQFKELHGVRTEASVTMMINGQPLAKDWGELQLTDYGISGIPVFQISHYIKRAIDSRKEPLVIIDFAPDIKQEELEKTLVTLIEHNSDIEVSQAINGIFNRKLGNVLIKEAKLKPALKCSKITSLDIQRLSQIIKHYTVIPVDTNGFENAQVCAGGVSLKEINEDTMESQLVKGLYIVGELADVDGICGGYNLQWAFASGHQAGRSAAGENK